MRARLRHWFTSDRAEMRRRYPFTVTTFANGREVGTRRLGT